MHQRGHGNVTKDSRRKQERPKQGVQLGKGGTSSSECYVQKLLVRI